MKPPPMDGILRKALKSGGSRFLQLSRAPIGPAPEGQYRHWHTLRHVAPPNGLTPEEWWLAIKLARQHLYQALPITAKDGSPFVYAPHGVAQRMLHEIDRDAGGAIRGVDPINNPATRNTYLLKSLFEEAITSSQLEGAATTAEVAKDMLRLQRPPRNRSEQMIFNNYQAMQFIRSLGTQPLTPAIVFELQRILTHETLDDPDAAGRFRKPSEEIHVVDAPTGKTLHKPPEAHDLPRRMDVVCSLANDTDDETFLHPVVRAVLLHFAVGYDHPFVDGNGRTARALFYWAMHRYGYWLCEFISISSILNKAPAKYAEAYLYTETDDNDVTYFVLSQLRVVLRAIEKLHKILAKKTEELRRTQDQLQQSATLRSALNHRQLAVVNHALKNPLFSYTIESHKGSHTISYQTARSDLMELADLGLLERTRFRRRYEFKAPADLHERIQNM